MTLTLEELKTIAEALDYLFDGTDEENFSWRDEIKNLQVKIDKQIETEQIH